MEDITNKISVVTICYNCCRDAELTVRSVLAQSYEAMEYIVVDGGSTDGTLSMLEQYRNGIDIIISEPDNGIYDALNKGIRATSGEWILCMNAGDAFVSDNVLTDIFCHPIPPEKSILYSDFYLCHADGSRQLRATSRQKGELHHQNLIYRRRLHEQYGYYIVTRPYIVSDLLFFLAVPAEQYQKLPTPIANVKAGGISDAQWCTDQAWCAKAIYGIESMRSILWQYVRAHISIFVRTHIIIKLKNLLRHED